MKETLRGEVGDCKSLALEWGLFSPVTFAQPQVCGGGEQLRSQLSGGHTRAAVDERKMQVCFLFCLQPATAQEQVAPKGRLTSLGSRIQGQAPLRRMPLTVRPCIVLLIAAKY